MLDCVGECAADLANPPCPVFAGVYLVAMRTSLDNGFDMSHISALHEVAPLLFVQPETYISGIPFEGHPKLGRENVVKASVDEGQTLDVLSLNYLEGQISGHLQHTTVRPSLCSHGRPAVAPAPRWPQTQTHLGQSAPKGA